MRESHFDEDKYLQEQYGDDDYCDVCELNEDCQNGTYDGCILSDDVLYDIADRQKHDDKLKELNDEELR